MAHDYQTASGQVKANTGTGTFWMKEKRSNWMVSPRAAPNACLIASVPARHRLSVSSPAVVTYHDLSCRSSTTRTWPRCTAATTTRTAPPCTHLGSWPRVWRREACVSLRDCGLGSAPASTMPLPSAPRTIPRHVAGTECSHAPVSYLPTTLPPPSACLQIVEVFEHDRKKNLVRCGSVSIDPPGAWEIQVQVGWG